MKDERMLSEKNVSNIKTAERTNYNQTKKSNTLMHNIQYDLESATTIPPSTLKRPKDKRRINLRWFCTKIVQYELLITKKNATKKTH